MRSPPDLVDGREATALLDARGAVLLGPLGERTCVAVDLDTPGAPAALYRRVDAPVVVVGVSAAATPPPAPAGCDVLLSAAADPPRPWVGSDAAGVAGHGELLARVAANPTAAAVLVQVLRAGLPLEVGDALAVESLAYSTLQAGPELAAWLRSLPARRHPPVTTGPPVTVERAEPGTLAVTLNRPAKRNAYDAAMRDHLAAALDVAIADDTVERVVLRARGPSFCSGGDLDEFGTTPDPATAHLVRTGRSVAARFAACAPRIVAYLHGHCVGAGIELPAFAGRVVADPAARFALPEVGMGLIPGAGGTASIPRRIGRRRTAWLALSGTALTAPVAHRWGLVDELEAVRPAS